MLKYNGSILKLPSKAIVDYMAPPGPVFDEVTIGTQTWTAKVIDIDDDDEGITTYNDLTVNNVNLGNIKFYTWDAAVRIANTVNGWHLPSKSEVDTLVNYIGGGYNSTTANALKATTVWSTPGSDTYGFNALPYGIYQPSGNYVNGGLESTIWQSDNHYRMYILNDNTIVNGYEGGDYRFPVRLIKDAI